MGTRWELLLPAQTRQREQAVQAAFDLLEQIEGQLSSFIPGSDLSRLNQAKMGKPVPVGEHCFECLNRSRRLHQQTRGAFDPTVGPLIRLSSDATAAIQGALQRIGMNHLHFDEGSSTITKLRSGMQLDTGGMGKGYALDQMAELLHGDWEIADLLLHSGTSTILAVGRSSYPTGIEAPSPYRLRQNALSTSGTARKGNHILDPRNGKRVSMRDRVWVLAKTAIAADALSTACMVLGEREIAELCNREEIAARWKRRNGSWARLGDW